MASAWPLSSLHSVPTVRSGFYFTVMCKCLSRCVLYNWPWPLISNVQVAVLSTLNRRKLVCLIKWLTVRWNSRLVNLNFPKCLSFFPKCLKMLIFYFAVFEGAQHPIWWCKALELMQLMGWGCCMGQGCSNDLNFGAAQNYTWCTGPIFVAVAGVKLPILVCVTPEP